ncbi:Pollen-specific arabinogalacta protein BAN102 [Zea mays]|uniref:Pollen-specific arabinogalacta protein BAN102 n=1 Tax=Zea mays TaxID=4577 RepID=A0A1D6NZP6_MAIZE|nr:Pollen-specific arabinogalacta protein BAN102 [Zea mays]
MEMKKVACAVLAAAASATVVLAAEAPAPAPTSASSAAFPAVGAVLGASVLSFFAYYLHFIFMAIDFFLYSDFQNRGLYWRG